MTAGNRTVAHRDVWVAGKGEWWFEVGDHDRIDLIPEKKRYEPGEKAVFQVRMPFREATALITVEREGVIEGMGQKDLGEEPCHRGAYQRVLCSKCLCFCSCRQRPCGRGQADSHG